MGFIIKKSSNGERSYEHHGLNKTKPNLIEDMITALKGLTIKLEIKFDDVIRQSDTVVQTLDRNVPVVPTESVKVSSEPTKLTPKPAEIVPKPSRVVPEPARFVPEPVRVIPELPKVVPELPKVVPEPPRSIPEPARVVSEPPRSAPESARVVPEPARVVIESARVAPEPARVATEPLKVAPEPPKIVTKPVLTFNPLANLIRGEIPVGRTIQTCPIAVDDSINPPGAYISYDDDKLIRIAGLISDISNDIEEIPPINFVNVGDIVFCKSREDNQWYRTIVENVNGETADVYYFDWGIREMDLTKDRIKRLLKPELGLSSYPACAIKLKFRNIDSQKLDDVLKCETTYLMKVESYDNSSDAYEVTVLDKLDGF